MTTERLIEPPTSISGSFLDFPVFRVFDGYAADEINGATVHVGYFD
jgi:hypothetical protein